MQAVLHDGQKSDLDGVGVGEGGELVPSEELSSEDGGGDDVVAQDLHRGR